MSNPLGTGGISNPDIRLKAEPKRLEAWKNKQAKRVEKAREFCKTLDANTGEKISVSTFRSMFRQWADPNHVIPTRTIMLPENGKLREILEEFFPSRVDRRKFPKGGPSFVRRNGSFDIATRIGHLELNVERIYSVVKQIQKEIKEIQVVFKLEPGKPESP